MGNGDNGLGDILLIAGFLEVATVQKLNFAISPLKKLASAGRRK
jgi:hypothetical protein